MIQLDLIGYIKVIIIVLLIIGGGLFILNQTVAWRYKAQFLQGPCELCAELNPNFSSCYKEAFIIARDGGGNIVARREEAEQLIKNEIEKKLLFNISSFNLSLK